MRLPGADVTVAFTLLEAEDSSRADTALRLDVELSTGAVAARKDVWIERADWNRFIDDLRSLDRTRRGDAALASMSGSELQFRVFASDRAGHLAVDAQLSHLGSPKWTLAIRGAEVDSEWFGEFVTAASRALGDFNAG